MEGDHRNDPLDETMMDGQDDDNSNNNNIWDVVDSWLNLDPQEESPDHDHHHHHHHHGSAMIDGSSTHHDDNQNRRNVGGSDGIGGGNEGRSMSDQGIGNDFEIEDHQEDDSDDDDQLPLQIVWPSVPVPDSCSSCQVLREIVHTKDTHTTKLEIHGNVGVIAHAVYSSNGGSAISAIQNQHLLDFSRQNLIDIKEYLKDYLEEHGVKGCTMLQEPLSLYYEALTTGYDWRSFDHNAGPLVVQGETSSQATNPNQRGRATTFKTELALQRERVKKMKLEDFAKYFDKRINDASEELQICATVIKRKLRSYNISRWPYRKVESMKKKISDLKAKYANVRSRRAEAEINKLQQKVDNILSGKSKP